MSTISSSPRSREVEVDTAPGRRGQTINFRECAKSRVFTAFSIDIIIDARRKFASFPGSAVNLFFVALRKWFSGKRLR